MDIPEIPENDVRKYRKMTIFLTLRTSMDRFGR